MNVISATRWTHFAVVPLNWTVQFSFSFGIWRKKKHTVISLDKVSAAL